MPKVRYSRKADADLDEIASFIIENWGVDQAEN